MVWEGKEKEQKTIYDVICILLFQRGVCVCVCVTVKEQGHTGKSLHRSDEQLHQRLPATLWPWLVDLDNESSVRVWRMDRNTNSMKVY